MIAWLLWEWLGYRLRWRCRLAVLRRRLADHSYPIPSQPEVCAYCGHNAHLIEPAVGEGGI